MNSNQVTPGLNPTTSNNKQPTSSHNGGTKKLSTFIKIFKPWKWKKNSLNKKKFDKNGSKGDLKQIVF